MFETFRGVGVDELSVTAGGVLTAVRIPEPEATVRGVVLHTPGDPAPEPDLLTLCTAPAEGIPATVAVVVRESDIAETLSRVPASTAVFTAPATGRWSDVYDQLQWAMRDAFGLLAAYDAFELADALATAVGGAVAIEDTARRVVAFSTIPGQPIDDVRRRGILDRNVPEHVERDRWYAMLWRNTGVLEFTDGQESSARLAIAVRAGGEAIGSIWVVGSRATLNPDADEILQRSVSMVAACLTHQDRFASRGRHTRQQLVRQVLTAGSSPATGFELTSPVRVVAIGRTEPCEDAELLDIRLSDVLSLQAQRCQGFGLAAAMDDRVYAVLPATDRRRFDEHLKATLARTAPAKRRVAVSAVLHEPAQLPRARREVDRLLGLPARLGSITVYVDDERDTVALGEIADAVRSVPALREGTIATIAEFDREHATSYVATLRAWFDACGDVAVAAARLHVHANTFRYRMTRVATLFGVELDQPDQRLLLHLQLRLRDFE